MLNQRTEDHGRLNGHRLVACFAAAVCLSGALALAEDIQGPTPVVVRTQRTILYWYDPMHPQYRSDKPGLAPDCGMEMVPMYADEVADAQQPLGSVRISALKQQLTGIRTIAVSRRVLTKTIRTVGIVQADESRIHKVHTKFPGWIEKLFVDSTGQAVNVGEPIVTIYSPDLVSTQQEYLLARRGEAQLHHSPFPQAAQSARSLLEAARRRLRLWDITPAQIRELEETDAPRNAVTLYSPAAGYVTAKDVFQGLYVTPEIELYTVTDLSHIWALLDVYEYEMSQVRVGASVHLRMSAYPGETFSGTVVLIYPYLEAKTRTNKVRVELANPELRLKPDMFANAEIMVDGPECLAIPEDAVLDSGTRQVVFVATGDGYFQPRAVRLGQRGEGYVEVLEGVTDGDLVVVAANFMVDSESQLKAALSAIDGGAHPH